MVKFASRPVGGYLRNGMAKVGVKTSCVPGYNKTKIWLETFSRKWGHITTGRTSLFSCVIQRNLFVLLCPFNSSSSSFVDDGLPKEDKWLHKAQKMTMWFHIVPYYTCVFYDYFYLQKKWPSALDIMWKSKCGDAILIIY